MPILVTMLLLLVSGCGAHSVAEANNPDLRLIVDISDRRLHLLRGDEVIRSYPVAVGKPTHPTPTGSFTIHQIDWNPDWTPTDSEWTEGEEYTPPGHPDNPMGRVRMRYQPPYSIHGTDALHSLGQAASHGSIRMANDDIIELAPMLMEAGGAARSEAWRQRVLGNPHEMAEVPLPNPIPLTNR